MPLDPMHVFCRERMNVDERKEPNRAAESLFALLLLGAVGVGIAGLVIAIFSAAHRQWVGSGLCLFASAVSFAWTFNGWVRR